MRSPDRKRPFQKLDSDAGYEPVELAENNSGQPPAGRSPGTAADDHSEDETAASLQSQTGSRSGIRARKAFVKRIAHCPPRVDIGDKRKALRYTGIITGICTVLIVALVLALTLSSHESDNEGRLHDSRRDRTISNYLKPLLITRVPGTPNHAIARTHLTDTMQSLGFTVHLDSFNDSTPYGPKPFHNIIAARHPNSAKRLILSAHYDSMFWTEPEEFIGATDSAAPCAILLEVARLLKPGLDSLKESPPVGLQFVFFDGEEAWKQWSASDSLYGSRHLAQVWKNTPVNGEKEQNMLQNIQVLVLLDLLGTNDAPVPPRQSQTLLQYNRMAEIERNLQNKSKILPIKSAHTQLLTSHPLQDHFSAVNIEDDHVPFMRAGVPIMHLIPVPFPSVWHQASDNESALDFDVIYNWSRILAAWTAETLKIPLEL